MRASPFFLVGCSWFEFWGVTIVAVVALFFGHSTCSRVSLWVGSRCYASVCTEGRRLRQGMSGIYSSTVNNGVVVVSPYCVIHTTCH
jgi:hypothetical protein